MQRLFRLASNRSRRPLIIGKALLKLGVSAEVSLRISEMNEKILSAQESAIAARDYQSSLLKQIGNLEQRVADLEAWDAEAETYELANIRDQGNPNGAVFAYRPKKDTHMGEPPHFICEPCFQEGHKALLHSQILMPGRCDTLICYRCVSVIYLTGQPFREHVEMRSKSGSRRK
jgi:hypothetical protein